MAFGPTKLFVVWQPCRFQNLGIMIDRISMENESHHAKKSWNPLCLTWVHWYLDFCLHTPSSPPNNSMNNDLKIPLKSGQMLWSMSSEGKSPKGSGPFQASFQWNIPQLPVPIQPSCTQFSPSKIPGFLSANNVFQRENWKKYLTMVSANQKYRWIMLALDKHVANWFIYESAWKCLK